MNDQDETRYATLARLAEELGMIVRWDYLPPRDSMEIGDFGCPWPDEDTDPADHVLGLLKRLDALIETEFTTEAHR